MSERSASKVGGSSSLFHQVSTCRFARSLKSFQPTNRTSFHASARIHVHGKNVSPTARASGGSSGGWKKSKKGKNDGGRYEKEKESRGTIENHVDAVCFFTANRRSHGHCQPLDFQRFSSIFSCSICHWLVLIGT